MVGKLFFATSISVRVLAKTSSSGMSVLDQLSLGSSLVVLSELGAKEWGAPSLSSRLGLRSLATRFGPRTLVSRFGSGLSFRSSVFGL